MGTFVHFLFPKLLAIVALSLIVVIGNATYKEMNRGNRIQEEINALRSEAQTIRNENSLLKEKIRYFQTDDFQAKEARDTLNYQKENERVVVIQPINDQKETLSYRNTNDDSQSMDRAGTISNYEKWWRRFSLF